MLYILYAKLLFLCYNIGHLYKGVASNVERSAIQDICQLLYEIVYADDSESPTNDSPDETIQM